MALTPPAPPSSGANNQATTQLPSPEERIANHFHEIEEQLAKVRDNQLLDWDRRLHVYKAIEEYNDAVAIYNTQAKLDAGPSEALKQIDWEGYRQRIFRLFMKVPGISKLKVFNAKKNEQRCYALKNRTQPPGDLICIEEKDFNLEEVPCQPGQEKFERPNEKLFFCYPEKWNPNWILTGKPRKN